jgi:hypothetical protein
MLISRPGGKEISAILELSFILSLFPTPPIRSGPVSAIRGDML